MTAVQTAACTESNLTLERLKKSAVVVNDCEQEGDEENNWIERGSKSNVDKEHDWEIHNP